MVFRVMLDIKLCHQKWHFKTFYQFEKETLWRFYLTKVKLKFYMLLKTFFTQVFKLEVVIFQTKLAQARHFSLLFIFYDLSCISRSQRFPARIFNSYWLEWHNFLVQIGVYNSPQENHEHVWFFEALEFSSHLGLQTFSVCLVAPQIFKADTRVFESFSRCFELYSE